MIFNYFDEVLSSGNKYKVIYADPPWTYSNTNALLNLPYDTMSMDELFDLNVKQVSEKVSVLFMWAVNPLLPEALDLMTKWGFTYKTNFVWDKVSPSFAYYNKARHELLLVGTRGFGLTLLKKRKEDSIITEKKTKHSVKPLKVISWLDEWYPDGKRLEMFSRNPQNGWDCFGNEI